MNSVVEWNTECNEYVTVFSLAGIYYEWKQIMKGEVRRRQCDEVHTGNSILS